MKIERRGMGMGHEERLLVLRGVPAIWAFAGCLGLL